MLRKCCAVWLLLLVVSVAQAQVTELCPSTGIQPRPSDFEPGGIILTAFDGSSLWVYDIDRATRYPLPETRPCTTNCRLSPDGAWLTYMNPDTSAFNKMRLDGTQRTPITGSVADVIWYDEGTYLVWTPDHRAYLLQDGELDVETARVYLPVDRRVALQPGGRYAVAFEHVPGESSFLRVLTNVDDPTQRTVLAPDTTYFNDMSWSPDGRVLAYVGRGAFDSGAQIAGAELYLIYPGSAIPQQLTFLTNTYGAVRINGRAPRNLAWSPDGTKIAFWVAELLGPNVEDNTGNAMIHVLDVTTGDLTAYCGYVTDEHTPNPSRLAWSPDSTHVALAGNVPGDDKGYLLMALNVEEGTFTELSDGIFPALGVADVVAWGLSP